jgi:hypothetical protein
MRKKNTKREKFTYYPHQRFPNRNLIRCGEGQAKEYKLNIKN